MSLIQFIANNIDRILTRTTEHIFIATSALLMAMLVAIPLGILLTRVERLAKPVLGIGNIIMTIPSLALLAFMLPVLGIGNRPAIAALLLYSLMPIMRNTYTGIKQVQPSLIEAARGMGMTDFQVLYSIELPLALSIILAGIRTTYVILIGWATLAAFIGGGGLGQLIWAGLTNINYNLILSGAIPAALLALLADLLLGYLETRLTPRGIRKKSQGGFRMNAKRNGMLAISVILITSVLMLFLSGCSGKSNKVTLKVGAQNYAEVITMAYMAEALIEDQTDYEVEVVARLGSAVVLDQAMQSGDVDIGSLLFSGGATGLLHPKMADQITDLSDPKWRDARTVFNFVKEKQPALLGRTWIDPLGYENTYAVTVKRALAEKHGLKKISDLKGLSSNLIIGMDDAYLDRKIDGYQPLLKLYELDPFKQTVSMQINLLYQALRDGQVDVGVAYSSDARIYAYDLVWLEDDRKLYPPFEAAYAVNLKALEKAPGIDKVIGQLSGKIDIATIRKLNYEVDINQRDHKEVALEYLKASGLLK